MRSEPVSFLQLKPFAPLGAHGLAQLRWARPALLAVADAHIAESLEGILACFVKDEGE